VNPGWRNSIELLIIALLGLLLTVPYAVADESGTIILHPTSSPLKRFALVIGNGAYRNVQSLRNPTNDAASISAKLQQLGYSVVYARDVDRRGMNEAVDTFLVMIEPGSEALVYYSGHGVDLNGSNYLLPVDIPAFDPDQERMFRLEGINVNDLLLDLQARSARVNVVILDACRDNPFREAKVTGGQTRSLGATRGLAAIEPPRGTFIMFSAGVGEQALDNLGSNDPVPNGLFTRKLLALMDQDGLEIHSLILQLRSQVQEAALTAGGHSQMPGYYDQISGEFYFRPKSLPPDLGQTSCEALVDEKVGKDALLAANLDAGVQACARAIEDHPADTRLTQLLQVAEDQRAAQRALQSTDRALSDAYLVLFPAGHFAGDVKEHLASLNPMPTPISPQPVKPPKPTIDPTQISRVLQVELKRVGCDPLTLDGTWGASSERALKLFNQNAHAQFNLAAPTLEAIEGIRAQTARICPLTCGPGEQVVGDQCLPVGCRRGLHISRSGTCIADIALRPRAVPDNLHRQAGTHALRIAPRSNCFNFNGESFCN
jgi:hypothetical protein